MTSVAIMAVLAASAVPVYSSILGNSEIRSATDSISYGLRVARNEAIKRNAVVTFDLAATADGRPGWTVRQVNDDSMIRSNSVQEIGVHVNVVAKPAAAVSLAFSPFGMAMSDASDATIIQQLVIGTTTEGSAHPLQINVNGKYVRVCDPSSPRTAQNPTGC